MSLAGHEIGIVLIAFGKEANMDEEPWSVERLAMLVSDSFCQEAFLVAAERAGVMNLIEGHSCRVEGTEYDRFAAEVDCVLGSLLGPLVEKAGN